MHACTYIHTIHISAPLPSSVCIDIHSTSTSFTWTWPVVSLHVLLSSPHQNHLHLTALLFLPPRLRPTLKETQLSVLLLRSMDFLHPISPPPSFSNGEQQHQQQEEDSLSLSWLLLLRYCFDTLLQVRPSRLWKFPT